MPRNEKANNFPPFPDEVKRNYNYEISGSVKLQDVGLAVTSYMRTLDSERICLPSDLAGDVCVGDEREHRGLGFIAKRPCLSERGERRTSFETPCAAEGNLDFACLFPPWPVGLGFL